MTDLKKAKEIINYISEHGLCETYDAFPFTQENTADAEDFEALLAEYPSCDKLAETLRQHYRVIGTHLRVKKEKTPALLKTTGYIVDADKKSNSFFCGRENELLKMNIAINKKIKNNIMLVGNPGTGKTRLVEEFAVKNGIHNVFVVECAKLIGSTEYRGAFEQRTTDLLRYAKSCGLIIFFDEIHTLINLGKSTGGMSITDILKPYLTDEEMVFMGATTLKEYLYFAEDEAFKRRFSVIRIDEPADDELVLIKASLERNVFGEQLLSDSDTVNAVNQLRKALPTMYFPDKLIDFLDYLYSYRSISQSDVNYSDVLAEFIADHKAFDI